MKNLTNALQKGNLKPKERVLLLVHNAVKEETTGKGILSEAEKHAISDGWQPTNNEQVKEYNRYNQGWKTAGFAELDAQTTFLETKIIFLQEGKISLFLYMYPFYREAKLWLDKLDIIKPVTIEQANEIVKKQREIKLKEGQNFDYAVYLLAFESLDKAIQKDLETLYDEVGYDHTYLDQEEALYDLLKGKDKPTAEDKDKIADLIVDRAYNKFAKEWQLWHYYASIPLKEIGKKWIDKRGVKIQKPSEYGIEDSLFNEARKKIEKAQKKELSTEEALKEFISEGLTTTLKAYAKNHKTTVRGELKEVVREWLDNGLLEEYEPLFKSTSKEAYNGKTKLPHNELFKLWLEAKDKARETLEGLIKEGKLKREGSTITGDSLYSFKGKSYKFIEEFKKDADRYNANLGIVYADDDPDHKGQYQDRELLITELNKEGKPHPINFSQMAIAHIKTYINGVGLLKETEVDGERVIEFNDERFTETMKKTTKGLKDHYAILLSFKELFRRLSKTYGIDLSYKIDKWIEETEGFIDDHNETLKMATKKGFSEITDNKVVRFKEDFYIDKDKVKPDQERVAGYFKELEDLLGDDF